MNGEEEVELIVSPEQLIQISDVSLRSDVYAMAGFHELADTLWVDLAESMGLQLEVSYRIKVDYKLASWRSAAADVGRT